MEVGFFRQRLGKFLCGGCPCSSSQRRFPQRVQIQESRCSGRDSRDATKIWPSCHEEARTSTYFGKAFKISDARHPHTPSPFPLPPTTSPNCFLIQFNLSDIYTFLQDGQPLPGPCILALRWSRRVSLLQELPPPPALAALTKPVLPRQLWHSRHPRTRLSPTLSTWLRLVCRQPALRSASVPPRRCPPWWTVCWRPPTPRLGRSWPQPPPCLPSSTLGRATVPGYLREQPEWTSLPGPTASSVRTTAWRLRTLLELAAPRPLPTPQTESLWATYRP
jgi:hypothetical protein